MRPGSSGSVQEGIGHDFRTILCRVSEEEHGRVETASKASRCSVASAVILIALGVPVGMRIVAALGGIDQDRPAAE